MKTCEVYRIFFCPRCTHFKFDAEPKPLDFSHFRRIGFCNSGEGRGEVPVKQDPQFTLIDPPEDCPNWEKGKPRKDKAKRKKKNEISSQAV